MERLGQLRMRRGILVFEVDPPAGFVGSSGVVLDIGQRAQTNMNVRRSNYDGLTFVRETVLAFDLMITTGTDARLRFVTNFEDLFRAAHADAHEASQLERGGR